MNLLRDSDAKEAGERGLLGKIRKLLPARDDIVPLYVVGHGNTVRKKGDLLEIWSRDETAGKEGRVREVRLREISQVNLFGGVDISMPALVELMQRGIPVLHFSHWGWFQGLSAGHTHKNVQLRMRQFAWAEDRKKSLTIARSLVYGKIRNSRTQMREAHFHIKHILQLCRCPGAGSQRGEDVLAHRYPSLRISSSLP